VQNFLRPAGDEYAARERQRKGKARGVKKYAWRVGIRLRALYTAGLHRDGPDLCHGFDVHGSSSESAMPRWRRSRKSTDSTNSPLYVWLPLPSTNSSKSERKRILLPTLRVFAHWQPSCGRKKKEKGAALLGGGRGGLDFHEILDEDSEALKHKFTVVNRAPVMDGMVMRRRRAPGLFAR
jgi:hypothetical protein